MIIIPRSKPVVQNINSYYIDMEKMIEHYQGDLRTGGIDLKAPHAQGAVFFDETTITNVFFEAGDRRLDGVSARDELIRNLREHNFTICVYQIEPEKFHYWANLGCAQALRCDPSVESLELDGLIRRMNAENLTGFIEVAFTGAPAHDLIFFNNGHIIDVSSAWEPDGLSDIRPALQRLIMKSKKSKATYNVKKIDLNRFEDGAESGAGDKSAPGDVIALLQALLATLESLVAAEKRIKTDFDTLLKKKFFEKADSYEFLDPFAAEVQYADGVLQLSGETPLPQIAKAVWESALELAQDTGLSAPLHQGIGPLRERYRNEFIHCGIEI